MNTLWCCQLPRTMLRSCEEEQVPEGTAVPPAPVPPCWPLEVLSVVGPIHLNLRHHLTNISNSLFKEKQKNSFKKRTRYCMQILIKQTDVP